MAWAAQWEVSLGPAESDLTRYVRTVFDPLVPTDLPSPLRLRAYVIGNALPNAFALANGCVAVQTGILARLDDETQLAFVLAHEIAHVVERHPTEALRARRRSALSADVAEILLAPFMSMIGAARHNRSLIDDALEAAQHGYDRGREKEADVRALALMSAAGWPVDGVAGVFARIEIGDDPAAGSSPLSPDHPTVRERESYVRDWIREHRPPPGLRDSAPDRYREQTRGVHASNAWSRILSRHYARAVRDVDRALALEPNDAGLRFLRGEAQLRLARDPDAGARELAATQRRKPTPEDRAAIESERPAVLAGARKDFERALELAPALSLAHRGLGLVAIEQGDLALAARELEAYLAGEPLSFDRAEIASKLAEIRGSR